MSKRKRVIQKVLYVGVFNLFCDTSFNHCRKAPIMNLNTEERLCVLRVCACARVRVQDRTVFRFLGVFCFFKHLSTSLLFFICVYRNKESISQFSAPDSRPLVPVTSSIPQATHPGDAGRGQAVFRGQSDTNSLLCSFQAAFPGCLVLCCFSLFP